MSSLRNKKGQLGNLAPAIMALIFAGILLVMGIVMSQSIVDTVDDVLVTVNNETFSTVDNNTGEFTTANTTCNFKGFSVVAAYNASNGWLIPSTNYTATGSSGNLVSTETTCTGVDGGESDFACGWDWNVTYTYYWGDEACVQGNESVVGLGTFADFWEIIVLAIVISLVIGLLLVVFGGRKSR